MRVAETKNVDIKKFRGLRISQEGRRETSQLILFNEKRLNIGRS